MLIIGLRWGGHFLEHFMSHTHTSGCFNSLCCLWCKGRLSQKPLFPGLPRSMPNADQCRSMPIKILALIPMSINSDQCRSMPINCELIGIDRHWSELIDIGINARILIGIDRHWSALGIDRRSPDTCSRTMIFGSMKWPSRGNRSYCCEIRVL